MGKSRKRTHKWYRLDLSANVYPTLQRRNFSSVYRITACMTEVVDPELLQKAVDRIMPRFPSFAVAIHKGIFWRYLEANTKSGPFVKADVANPCMPMRFKADNGYLVRIYYYNKKISMEAFHSLADGGGAMIFLKTLVAQYLRLQGHTIPCKDGVFDPDERPSAGELVDSYPKYGKNTIALKRREPRAYQVRGTMEPFYTLNIISGIADLSAALAVAKKYKVSLGEYLTAVLIQALIQKQKADKPYREREIKIAVPVNLRKYFPSDTIRNFIVMVKPSIHPGMGDYSFEEIVQEVHNYMRYHVTPKHLAANIHTNLAVQQNPIVRIVPLFIKDIVVRSTYRQVNDKQSTAGMTNLGIVQLPEKMRPFVERFEVMMGQPFSNRTNAAIVTYNNHLSITFTSSIVESDVEMLFFRHLVKEGIHVKIETNRSSC